MNSLSELAERTARSRTRRTGERGGAERVADPHLPHPGEQLREAAVRERVADPGRAALVGQAGVGGGQQERGECEGGQPQGCGVGDAGVAAGAAGASGSAMVVASFYGSDDALDPSSRRRKPTLAHLTAARDQWRREGGNGEVSREGTRIPVSGEAATGCGNHLHRYLTKH